MHYPSLVLRCRNHWYLWFSCRFKGCLKSFCAFVCKLHLIVNSSLLLVRMWLNNCYRLLWKRVQWMLLLDRGCVNLDIDIRITRSFQIAVWYVLLILLSNLITSTRFVTGLMHVNAFNSSSQSSVVIIHRPTESTATSLNIIVIAICGDKWSYPCPASFH